MARTSPITAQQWSQAQRLLDELELLPEAARRAALDARKVSDPLVRAEVESLLAAEAERGSFMNQSPWNDPVRRRPAPTLPPGTVLGAFRIEELIGRGGMAEVYRARRIEEFDQRVAIKLISGDAAPQLDAFQRERRILATLEHPGIARIVDGGITEGGRPYMVMEYVEGTDLIRHAQGQDLDLDARLRLFRQVCEAVAFAHRLLVIHRDLKPGNIRVTPDGQIKLLDFGVAKLIEPRARREDFETATIMTPEFAAPEQLYGEPVTTATDVYALGAVLFHLLSGVPPFRADGRAMHLLIDQRLRSEMPQLSATAGAQPDPPVPPRLLRGDLDAIVTRATRRKPADRYASVDALSADVARHLAREPVIARRGSTAYEIGRLLRRHRVAVAAAAAMGLAVVAGMVGTMWQAHVARDAESAALAQADRARRTKTFFVQTLAHAGASDRLSAAIDDAQQRVDTLGDDPDLQAELLADLARIRVGRGDLGGARALFERALNLQEQRLAPDAPVLADLLEARGATEAAWGAAETALPFLERALAIRERYPDQVEALWALRIRLGCVEQDLGRHEAALAQLASVVASLRAVGDGAQLRLADVLSVAADSALALGRAEQAEAWSREALSLVQGRGPIDPSHLILPLRRLADVAEARGDTGTARAQLVRALELAREAGPMGRAERLPILVDLAVLDLAQGGEVAQAERALQEALERADPAAHADASVVDGYRVLALSRFYQDRLDEARDTVAAGLSRCADDARRACVRLHALDLRLAIAAGNAPDREDDARRWVEALQAPGAIAATDRRRMQELAELRLALAEAQSALGRHAEAARTLREVLQGLAGVGGGVAWNREGLRWRYAIERLRQGDPEALAEVDRFLAEEKAGPGADAAARLIAVAEFERTRGRVEVASLHAQQALREYAVLGPIEARRHRLAVEFAAALH